MVATTCLLLAVLAVGPANEGRRDFTLWSWSCRAWLVVDAVIAEEPTVERVENQNTGVRVVVSQVDVIRGELPAERSETPRADANSPAASAPASGPPRQLSVLVWCAGTAETDRPSWLRRGQRVLLFLAGDNQRYGIRSAWETVDLWFGALPYSPVLAQRLKWSVRPATNPIEAATRRRNDMPNYPPLPTLTPDVRGGAGNEVGASAAIRAALMKLDVSNRNVDWFAGVEELEKEKAVWCLQVCLIHSSEDAQINALRALERLGNRDAVPFLLIYAEYMAVFEVGSENAGIHAGIHQSLAKTLSALTGVRLELDGQDPEGLKRGIRQWRQWLLDNSK